MNIEIAKNYLQNNNLAIVIVKNDEIIFESNNKGIKPLYDASKKFKNSEKCLYVADKVIGKAAAILCNYIGASHIYAELISENAIDYLKNTSIIYEYEKCVPFIKNRDLSGMCPIENLSVHTNNPEELILKIEEFFEKIQSGGK